VAFYVLFNLAEYVGGKTSDASSLRAALEGALFGVLYISNIVQATGHLLPGGIGHLWSLATEEQFYLLWPLGLYGSLRYGMRGRGLAFGLGGVIAVLFAHRLELVHRGAPQQRLYFGPDNTFDVILIGCLAGTWFSFGLPRPLTHSVARRVGGWLGLVAVSLMVAFTTLWQRPLYGGLLSLFAVAGLFAWAGAHFLAGCLDSVAALDYPRERLETIVVNLIDNALKYSPPGGAVRLAVATEDASATLRVRDQGIGIAEADLPRLFTRFGRLVTAENSHIPGTGLGLYLSREIARMHGGDITVSSALGQGSEFTLTLPQAGPAAQSPSSAGVNLEQRV